MVSWTCYEFLASSALHGGMACVIYVLLYSKRVGFFGYIGNVCMNRVDHIYIRFKYTQGICNPYASEGPSVHARLYIKEANRHGLSCMFLNKSGILSVVQCMTHSVADFFFIQELNQKRPKFFKTKVRMKRGLITTLEDDNSESESVSDKWKCEGFPTIDGLNGGYCHSC